MKDIRPDLIISTGGYMSLAPGLVGSFFCPLIIHEQNSVPGFLPIGYCPQDLQWYSKHSKVLSKENG